MFSESIGALVAVSQISKLGQLFFKDRIDFEFARWKKSSTIYLLFKQTLKSEQFTLGVESNCICSKFVRFDLKTCDLIDSKGQKIFEKFDEN